jgi:hypothetical protein
MNTRSKPEDMMDKAEDAAVESRDRLSDTLDRLGDSLGEKLGPAVKVAQAAGVAQAGVIAIRQVAGVARAHPAAAAMATAAVVWLVASRRSDDTRKRPSRAEISRWEDEGGTLPDMPALEEWEDTANGLVKKLGAELSRIESSLRGAADKAKERATVLAAFWQESEAAVMKGLDEVPEQMRATVQAARKSAVSAKLRAEDALRSAGETAIETARRHPVATATGVAALFAALVSLLSRRRAPSEKALEDIAADLKASVAELRRKAPRKT